MKKNIVVILILLGASFSVQSQNLNELFHPKTIGLNKEYLEKITGPAKRVRGNTHQYELNKCNLDIAYSNNSVQSIALRNISKECSFDAKNIYLSGPVENITFGDIMGIVALWKAYESCIGACGNSHAQVHQMWGETPRARGSIQFIVGTTNSDPAFKMRDDILKMYTNLSFNDFSGGYLVTKIQWQPYYHYWINNFKNEKITSIQIGSNLNKDTTSSPGTPGVQGNDREYGRNALGRPPLGPSRTQLNVDGVWKNIEDVDPETRARIFRKDFNIAWEKKHGYAPSDQDYAQYLKDRREAALRDAFRKDALASTGISVTQNSSYGAKVRACVQPGVSFPTPPRSSATNPAAQFRVYLEPSGRVADVSLIKSSGNAIFDKAVQTGIRRCTPFPTLPSGKHPSSLDVNYNMYD